MADAVVKPYKAINSEGSIAGSYMTRGEAEEGVKERNKRAEEMGIKARYHVGDTPA